jgi:hypothetical protein
VKQQVVKEESKDISFTPAAKQKQKIRMSGTPGKDGNDDYMPIKMISMSNSDWVI